MSLIYEQVCFMRDVARLLAHAQEQHFAVTGGELERAPEVQASLMRAGRERSMDSPHLRKCAIVLNFFREANDSYTLEQSVSALEPMGSYWESLDPRNRWGARREGVLAAQRFERDLGGWPSTDTSSLLAIAQDAPRPEAVALADDARPGEVVLGSNGSDSSTPVLRRGTSERDAVARLQALLIRMGVLDKASGAFDDVTERAVIAFQRNNTLVADGVVGDKTWTTLLAQTAPAQEAMSARFIGDGDFEAAARDMKIELAALKAVYKVESNGKGFVGEVPKILFEGHVFWQRLKQLGLRPEVLARGNEDILYPAWTKDYYVGGAGEQQRLARAQAIDRGAALESASWGLFQIMGYHWNTLGYSSIDEFVDCMGRHERDQLQAFCRFIGARKDRSGRTLAQLLAQRDWTSFAYAYNGAGYRKNAYDDRLRENYQRFAAALH
jgi:hypothetical protein